ncbi:class I SAM-dependent methyltransferase [Methylobacterium brachiatum]
MSNKFDAASEEINAVLRKYLPNDSVEILPGTPYCRYAIPVDYTPSRNYQARWGTTAPLIPALTDWFAGELDSHRKLIEEMRAELTQMSAVPLNFEEQNLPSPAWQGVPYSPFDSLLLYTLLKKYRPATYLEIGSGITTCWANRALKDANCTTEIISIDPSPRQAVDDICTKVVRDGLETVDISIFAELQPNDILFFDGSHRSFMNSDVTVFFIDVLPIIKPGVIIHIHDISLPWDYDKQFENWYWNEQYLLAVYLMAAREKIELIAPTAWLCRQVLTKFDEQKFSGAVPGVEFWGGGGAMWFTKKA